MARYLMSSVVVFDGDLYQMSRIDDAEKVVQLGGATSRCLQVLLDAGKQIVTKNDLLHQGWEQYRNIVTGNSVNQAIAQIRKNFELMDLNPQGIVTVPRIGYKIADDFLFEKMEDKGSSIPSPSDVLSTIETPVIVPVLHEQADVPASQVETSKTRKSPWWLPILVAINVMLALSAWWFLRGDFIRDAASVEYVPVRKVGDVHYFAVQHVIGGSAHVENSIATLSRYPPVGTSLANKKYAYINGAARDHVFSYFLCQDPIEKIENGCISYLVLSEEAHQ